MTATVQTFTIEEFQNLPDDGVRRELVRGEVRELTPTNLRHLIVRHRIEWLLANFVHEHDLGIVGGEAGFVLAADPPTVLAPDIVFIRHDRVPVDEELDGFGRLAPDLAVEVVSPSNSALEMLDKTAIYLESGVRLVWIVDPVRKSIVVHHPDRTARTFVSGETIDGGDGLPGFAMAVADAFA